MRKGAKAKDVFDEERAKKINPNEMRGDDENTAMSDELEAGQFACPLCGMEKAQWSAEAGQGYERDREFYCCEGCAERSGCTCADDR